MSPFNEEALPQTQVSRGSQVKGQDSGAAGLETLCRDCKAVNWPTVNVWNDIEGIETDLLPRSDLKVNLKATTSLQRHIYWRHIWVVFLMRNGLEAWRERRLKYVAKTSFSVAEDLVKLSPRSGELSGNEKSKYLRLAVRSPASDRSVLQEDHDYVRFLLAHKHTDSDILQIRTLHPSHICFDFLKSKLEMCYKDHEECHSTATAPAGLRLIDVRTKKICYALPGYQYIALSYVWGNASSQNPEEDFPPVVQDAISVTEVLGCQYLWVDRYCIDQSSYHRVSMIQQMDRVYGNAFVTIIAASANSSQDGLPGMSGPPRRQETLKLGEINLVELSSVGQETVKMGKWATRGWTFQEGYLSKRRLIFTEKEVLLLCNHELVKETQAGSDADPYRVMDLSHRRARSEESHATRIRNSFYWMMPTARGRLNWKARLQEEIEEYSSRELSHEDDSLNALLGILRYHESISFHWSSQRISHLWGIPLNLHVGQHVSFNLLWQGETIGLRRKGFPSWSWLGWAGSFRFTDLGDQLKVLPQTEEEDIHGKADEFANPTLSRMLQIRLPHGDGTIDLHQFMRDRDLETSRHADPAELIVQSQVISLRLRNVHTHPGSHGKAWEDPSNWEAQEPVVVLAFLLKPGVFVGIPVSFDKDYDPKYHMRGLVLPNDGSSFLGTSAYSIVILHRIENGRYERAGIVNLSYTAESGLLENGNRKRVGTRSIGWDWDIHMNECDRVIKR
ncbi:hypothetical protein CcaCcLH18_08226 [Colletotrichum camelliae]|nr:hypothetical protein CcaCcLH18_08226 [Colletotrichum camelliae]